MCGVVMLEESWIVSWGIIVKVGSRIIMFERIGKRVFVSIGRCEVGGWRIEKISSWIVERGCWVIESCCCCCCKSERRVEVGWGCCSVS